jgi:hypothetical protein
VGLEEQPGAHGEKVGEQAPDQRGVVRMAGQGLERPVGLQDVAVGMDGEVATGGLVVERLWIVVTQRLLEQESGVVRG